MLFLIQSLKLSDFRSVIFQVIEENPEPVPGEAFSESGVAPPAGQTWDSVIPTVAPGTSTGGGVPLFDLVRKWHFVGKWKWKTKK